MYTSQVTARGGGRRDPSGETVPATTGVMVRPFPEPGPATHAIMVQLHLASVVPPNDEEAVHVLSQMPRPWDPSSCTGRLRSELWEWFELVAIWVNEQYLWNVTRLGIPECWPAHPHLVHDLAVLACGRYYTRLAVTPAPLEEWHRYTLPGFLERLQDRLGDACQPGKHQPRPRHERDIAHSATPARRRRTQRYLDDAEQAEEVAASPRERSNTESDALHKGWSTVTTTTASVGRASAATMSGLQPRDERRT